ncbi:MAG: FAD-dependent oxidoreductase, partial [Pseudomonadota bacterium]
MTSTIIIGGGLAGCEATWQLLQRGRRVVLYEMKPLSFSPAHKSPHLAELVCSNSLRSNSLDNAVGLLKEEMRRLGSLIMAAADANAVPAGSALAVDRVEFS